MGQTLETADGYTIEFDGSGSSKIVTFPDPADKVAKEEAVRATQRQHESATDIPATDKVTAEPVAIDLSPNNTDRDKQ